MITLLHRWQQSHHCYSNTGWFLSTYLQGMIEECRWYGPVPYWHPEPFSTAKFSLHIPTIRNSRYLCRISRTIVWTSGISEYPLGSLGVFQQYAVDELYMDLVYQPGFVSTQEYNEHTSIFFVLCIFSNNPFYIFYTSFHYTYFSSYFSYFCIPSCNQLPGWMPPWHF